MPVKNVATLAALQPDMVRVQALSQALELVGFYLYARDASVPSHHATTRMFAPRYGVAEEAATGMAAGPLACHLADHSRVAAREIVIEQGHFMHPASPSLLHAFVTREAGRVSGVEVGGVARVAER